MYRNKLQTNVILSATIIAIGILLLSLSYSQSLSKFKGAISRIMTPLQVNIYSLVEPLFINQPIAPEELVNLNATLTAETALLRSENIRLSEAVYERDMLAALLNYTKLDNVHTYISANVIGKDTSSFLQYVIIDIGTTGGVQRDMPVVTDAGLVGIINEATPRASKVLLVNSDQMAVNVRIQNSRADGVLFGQASKDLRLRYIALDATISAGDLVVTSGLGGSLPANIPVGAIASVRSRAYDVFQEAEVLPLANLDKIEIVMIITDFTATELNPLISTPVPDDL
ncbi:MAG TPA: rod shape-determining protein MreC [Anaerolineales bacterium]|nr:rod shape-determining protein MreC [Anaerolineaceae bacterium]HJO90433.1 rod shape-determining protein MreC [Anaerolineales bacterium]|tara:strand:- start:211 stop:1065 length:855 start_codon:yes stop_codon:yes gene_type:complete